MWTWVWNQLISKTSPFETLLLCLSGLLTYLIKGIVDSQREINKTLTNHFVHDNANMSSISKHMGAQAELMRLILEETKHAR